VETIWPELAELHELADKLRRHGAGPEGDQLA
jgi:hypothetical protein